MGEISIIINIRRIVFLLGLYFSRYFVICVSENTLLHQLICKEWHHQRKVVTLELLLGTTGGSGDASSVFISGIL